MVCKKRKPGRPKQKKIVKKTRERAISKKGYERKIGRKTKVIPIRWPNGKIVSKSELKKMGLKNSI